MKRDYCSQCGQAIRQPRQPKPTAVPAVSVETLSDADLMAHYKKTAPIEDLKFFIRQCGNDSIRQDARILLVNSVRPGTDNLLQGNRKEFYRQLTALQAAWRQWRNSQDRQQSQPIAA